MKLNIKRNSMNVHKCQLLNCSFIQMSNEKFDAKKITTIAKKIIKSKIEIAINFESRSKIKTKQFFKSFKFEKFAINFNLNSISIKFRFESIIKSNVVFGANLIFTSIRSKSNFSRSISFNSISINLSIVETRQIMKIKKITYIRRHMKKIIVDQMFDSEKRSQLINLSYDKKFVKFDAKKIVVVVQKIMKKKIVVVVVVAIETIKSKIIVKNINYFDFIMQINF